MKKLKRSWMAMLMGMLLLGTLVGAVWARPQNRPEAQNTTRRVTIPGAFFNPVSDLVDSYNSGNKIYMLTAYGHFTAPVVFPCLSPVTVERLILYADDGNPAMNACAELHRTRLPQGADVPLGWVCSPAGTTTGVQPFIDDTISPNVVWPAHGVYVWIEIGGPNIDVYGVEPKLVDDAYRSFRSGKLETNTRIDTIADGLRTNLSERTLRYIQQNVNDILLVSEQDIIDAMRFLWERMKLVVEPSGAVSLAGVLAGRIPVKNKKVGIIISGGNVDLEELFTSLRPRS